MSKGRLGEMSNVIAAVLYVAIFFVIAYVALSFSAEIISLVLLTQVVEGLSR